MLSPISGVSTVVTPLLYHRRPDAAAAVCGSRVPRGDTHVVDHAVLGSGEFWLRVSELSARTPDAWEEPSTERISGAAADEAALSHPLPV
jgi:hypothetical protein